MKASALRGVPSTVLVLIAVLTFIGTGLAWSVVNHRAASEITLRGEAAPAGTPLRIEPSVALALVKRGAILVQRQCAGCHAPVGRLTGPSWAAISDRTGEEIKREPFCGAGLALVANAVTHPVPGWDGYAAGPSTNALSTGDRVALAAWILKQAANTTDAGGAR